MSGDAVSRLERAAALLDRGLLTASEFALVKSNILEEIDKGGNAAPPTPSAAPTPSAVAANKAKRHACADSTIGCAGTSGGAAACGPCLKTWSLLRGTRKATEAGSRTVPVHVIVPMARAL
jgi:hypothetical protein